ncbi:MAG TPA: cupin domain-containing protein [Candidatus Dormibacteraeota bacterium]|nr:cupin domain-containing protein [Candidatus Dormibacteraeota bacterium]
MQAADAGGSYDHAVKVTTQTEALDGEPMDPAHFTGPASSHPLHVTLDPHPVRVSVVRFEPGTRNHWHRHGGGQVLHVVEGEGFVQLHGEPAQRIRTGDTVSTAPGEVHCHGAGPGGPMAHVAVSIGDTTWLEPGEN